MLILFEVCFVTQNTKSVSPALSVDYLKCCWCLVQNIIRSLFLLASLIVKPTAKWLSFMMNNWRDSGL